jgi:hypothetical protein
MKKEPAVKQPKALKRQVQRLQMAKDFRDVEAARREHLMREHRHNLLSEIHRLQGAGERILPGLREHLTRRQADFRHVTNALRKLQ